ncbi:MAG: glycosyl transferase family 51, partial [Candidatus Latescibacteria bacterium]|nr:glycosyl transferase family 51 [Candidatus Latescibacterota bacterium]
ERKAASAIRSRLAASLDIPQLYELDRLDLTVSSTLDRRTQDEVTRMLTRLRDPEVAAQAGLRGFRLLEKGDPDKVIYSFTLFERGNRVNLMRVQADNFNQPLNINEGVKLELGSTAKLRTLITYLEVVAELHDRYAGQPPSKLRQVETPPSDQLSRWALNYLAANADTTLPTMLEAAMDRGYSGSPAEQFFTGGGMHTFANFEPDEDAGVFSVRQGLYRSINLVFIRLMRSIVRYYMFQGGGSPDIFEDPDDPARKVYLEKFADREGKEFLNRFYKKYQEKKKGKEQVTADPLERLVQDINPTPARLAVIFRTVKPDAGLDEFSTFLRAKLPNSVLSNGTLAELYKDYAIDAFSLADRGYIARVHPLELWLVAYLQQHPQTKRSELMDASAAERQEVYNWLFKTHQKNGQDSRIRTLLEVEAFEQIHRAWKRLGYPFESLVPSYATAIGVSGDRPAALAELMGILLNDGVRYPSVRAQELHFAQNTPFETILQPEREGGEQVLRPEIAKVVRETVIGVVEQGTARRVFGAFALADSTRLQVGGKTGTGDNRHEIYGAGGRLIDSQITSRTGTFVFLIGDRFFGTLTAYVAGKDAAGYKFTSSLPVQVLKVLAPKLMPLIERAYREEPQLQAPAMPPAPPPAAPEPVAQ